MQAGVQILMDFLNVLWPLPRALFFAPVYSFDPHTLAKLSKRYLALVQQPRLILAPWSPQSAASMPVGWIHRAAQKRRGRQSSRLRCTGIWLGQAFRNKVWSMGP